MKKFHRIYFDSNVAIKEGWPKISAALDSLLWVAKLFKISVVLLDVVERELEAHWTREYQEARRATQIAQEIHARVGLASGAMRLPELDDVRAAYRKTVDAIVEEHGLVRAKSELRPTTELFEMAIRELKPFQKKGRNFQDVVILLAAIDELARNSGQRGVFLSRDGVFDQSVMTKHSSLRKVELTLFPEVTQLSDVLKNELGEALKKVWDIEQAKAVSAVQRNAAQLRTYIAQNLEIPANPALEGEILSIEGIEDLSVLTVQTSDPMRKGENQPTTFTAEVEVSFRATIAPNLLQLALGAQKAVKVGAESRIVRNPWLEVLQPNEPKEQVIKRVVLVEIEATVVNKEYENLKFLSVRLK
jgi:hypothetical protein